MFPQIKHAVVGDHVKVEAPGVKHLAGGGSTTGLWFRVRASRT